MATYKRLLIRHEVEASGNCNVLDNTDILEVVTNTDNVDMSIIRRYDLALQQPVQSDHGYVDVPNNIMFNEYSTAAIGYIAEYVVRMAKKLIHCPVSIEALSVNDDSSQETQFASQTRD